ncbi:hypothetical protein A28LD_0992 [Idiomarina sp. A28L]|uniref:hypothetical protein n=1 Tax=Idiomarina sp. A28L TaxID=1036674 RepID=UPI0002138B91|nr:hypothetical protein [Idiomarina sp. A28L]EGN75379.1 hypothetical protein A28LD_0992 [Idiomarina sp. A28L]
MHRSKLMIRGLCVAGAVTLASACTAPDEQPQKEFFAALQSLCGNAYAGERVVERPGRDLLAGNEALIVHFRQCSENQVLAPFHIEKPESNDWDRSRTWIYTQYHDHLTLSHDHREPDGSPSEETDYGGATIDSGTAEQQMFIFTDRTGENGETLGWRIEIVPGERYSYGTMADGEWTWRVDFDLSEIIAAPPAPWGY